MTTYTEQQKACRPSLEWAISVAVERGYTADADILRQLLSDMIATPAPDAKDAQGEAIGYIIPELVDLELEQGREIVLWPTACGTATMPVYAAPLPRASDAPAAVPLEVTPNTLGGFRGAFYVANNRAPTEQEVFDAGVRSGLNRNAPATAAHAGAIDWIKEAIDALESAGGDMYYAIIARHLRQMQVAPTAAVDDGVTFEKWLKGPHEHGWNDQNHPLTVSEKVVALKGWKDGRASMPERKAVTDEQIIALWNDNYLMGPSWQKHVLAFAHALLETK